MTDTSAIFQAAIARHRSGQLREAEALCAQVLSSDPNHIDAWHLSGVLAFQGGQPAEAAARIRRAIELGGRGAALHFNLGEVYRALAQPAEAEACLRDALALDPGMPEAHFCLGNVLRSQGRADEALRAFEQAVQLRAGFYQAMLAVANHYESAGRLAEALEWYDATIQQSPQCAQAHRDRAYVLRALKRPGESAAGFQEALRLCPTDVDAYNGLVMLEIERGHMDEAIACCRRGLEIAPDSAALYANLSNAVQNLGRQDEAIEFARRGVELNPTGAAEHSNLLYKLNFHPAYSASAIFAEHLAWGQRHADPLTALAPPHANNRSTDRRLRVGYVSPYFRDHAVNFFVEPILAAHDHGQFEVFCYSDVQVDDAATARLRAAADHWRETRGYSDAQLADIIRADAIDILVDLTGHISGSRLLAFARKPAPVQVTYLGYQNTTGMRAMDYRLTDAIADPPGATERFHIETLVRLPQAFFCYRPSDEAPTVASLPALAEGRVTFGSFNNYFKVGPAVLDAWFEILARVPDARLLLLTYPCESLQAEFARRAAQYGVGVQRITLCSKRPRRQYFELMSTVDIALDSFPFNGHTTTCDAVWMGLPVLMLAGDRYASRFGASVLANVGLDEMIATRVEAYIETAVRWAGAAKRAELASLRQELRTRMAASPLTDSAAFTRQLESAYHDMWVAWRQRNK